MTEHSALRGRSMTMPGWIAMVAAFVAVAGCEPGGETPAPAPSDAGGRREGGSPEIARVHVTPTRRDRATRARDQGQAGQGGVRAPLAECSTNGGQVTGRALDFVVDDGVITGRYATPEDAGANGNAGWQGGA